MRPSLPLLLPLLVVPLVFVPSVGAQIPGGLHDFVFTAPPEVVLAASRGEYSAAVHVRDISKDSPSNVVPGAPGARVIVHQITFAADIISPNSRGWAVSPPAQVNTFGGDELDAQLKVTIGPLATNPYLRVRVVATMHPPDAAPVNHTVEVLFRYRGLLGVTVLSQTSQIKLSPREVGQGTIHIINNGIYQIQVSLDRTSNPCGLGLGESGAVVLAPVGTPGAEQTLSINVLAPSDALYYQSMSCQVHWGLVSADGGSEPVDVQMTVVVDGFYIDPQWVINLVVILVILMLLILFLRRRKERLEEQILGKPQKPWLIPVEKVYLRELKARDPRAWYVVRHYLMEEEYRSSLLWFKAYKAATKGDRKKERLILKQERKYESWKAAWAKAIAKPIKKADRFEAQLQRKLDRKARKTFRKARRKTRKLGAKIKASNAKLHKRAMEKWQKAKAKAEKKGRPVPPQPVAGAASLPAEPVQQAPALAEHRWSKKAARFRRRMVKRQGNLEVKFEKADARYLRRIRRKVARIARKLEDEAFVAEHPLLRAEPAAGGAGVKASK